MRPGFDLNIAPQIMRSIVDIAISQDDQIRKVTSAYIEDLYVNNDVGSIL